MVIYFNNKKYQEFSFQTEKNFETEIISNSKLLFGKNTICIDAKKKIEAKTLGGTIPDGFLFDLSDIDNPEFYLVEVELATHDFYSHIFPQITKFFAFFKNSKSQSELVEKIFSIVNKDSNLKRQFKKYLGEREIFKFIKDIIENSQNILLIIDRDKKELPEIIETYSDTWGKMVRVLTFKKFFNKNNDIIFSLEPDFENIEYSYVEKEESTEDNGTKDYTEEFHLDGVNEELKQVYLNIKQQLFKLNKDLIFNPQHYYLSIKAKKNIAFFIFRKKKIRLVVMHPEEEVRKKIKHNKIRHLSDGVQNFYNGACCEITIENKKNIKEVINILKLLIAESNK